MEDNQSSQKESIEPVSSIKIGWIRAGFILRKRFYNNIVNHNNGF